MKRVFTQITALCKAMLCAATILSMTFAVSCDKNDTLDSEKEPETETEPETPDSGDEDSDTQTEQKNISKVTFDFTEYSNSQGDECDFYAITTTYEYDEEGRISAMTGIEKMIVGEKEMSGGVEMTFAYGESEIVVTECFDEEEGDTSIITYTLKDGVIVSGNSYDEYDFGYNADGKLDYIGNNDTYAWDGDNIVRFENYDGVYTFEYSECDNPSNLDLNHLLINYGGCEEYALLARMVNGSSQKLISKYEKTTDGKVTFTFKYNDTVNPTEIVMSDGDTDIVITIEY